MKKEKLNNGKEKTRMKKKDLIEIKLKKRQQEGGEVRDSLWRYGGRKEEMSVMVKRVL